MIEMYPLQILALLGTGLVAGLSSGALGVGGAFIMVPVQFWALQSMGVDPTIAVRTSFGTSLLVLFPTALSGAIAHHKRGAVLWKAGVILGLTGASAAFIGAFVASRLPARLLTIVFGCVVMIMAIRMLTTHQPCVAERRADNYVQVILWGVVFGFVSGIIGVGGGGLMVPVMTNFLRFSVHEAVGTAAALMIFTALGGSVSYLVNGLGIQGLPAYSTGYLNWLQFSLLAGSSVPMAFVGAKVAHVLPSDRLKMILTLVMLYVGMKMIGIFSWLGLPL
jgi:uncharacterized protein